MSVFQSLFHLLLFAVWLALPTNLLAQQKADTAHISDDAFCIVHMNVGRIIKHHPADDPVVQKLDRFFKSEAGLNFSQIRFLTLQFGTPDLEGMDPGFCVTLDFSKKVDRDRFLDNFQEFEFTEEKFQGKTYLKPNRDTGPFIYFSSPNKFTMATPEMVKSVIKAESGMGDLSAKFRSAPKTAEILAAFSKIENVEKVSKRMVQNLMNEFGGVPVPLDVEEMIANLDSGFGSLDLLSKTPLQIDLQCKNEAAAKEWETTVKGLLKTAEELIPAAEEFLKHELGDLDADNDFAKAMIDAYQTIKVGLKLAKSMIKRSNIQQTESNFSWKVKQPEGDLKEAAKLLSRGLLGIVGVPSEEEPREPRDNK